MSYFHCGNGYPDRCNGYRGPLDASVCTSSRHKYDESGRQILPAAVVSEDPRDQLADAIKRKWVLRGDARAHDFADELMPVVERIAKERAAAEIRAIAHRLDDGDEEAIEVALGGAAYVHRILCDCAHALDGKP